VSLLSCLNLAYRRLGCRPVNYSAFAGGHHLNHLLTKKVFEEEAYEIVTFDEVKEMEFAKAFS